MVQILARSSDDICLIEDHETTKPGKRKCPRCQEAVHGRSNKIFCSSNCRKRYNEPTRNSLFSVSKRRENMELFDRAMRLAECFYTTAPQFRLGFIKDIIDIAREGNDNQLRLILTNYCLLHPNPVQSPHLFFRRNRAYSTIAQVAQRYCKHFWKKDVKLVVYNKVPYPDDGIVD